MHGLSGNLPLQCCRLFNEKNDIPMLLTVLALCNLQLKMNTNVIQTLNSVYIRIEDVHTYGEN